MGRRMREEATPSMIPTKMGGHMTNKIDMGGTRPHLTSAATSYRHQKAMQARKVPNGKSSY